MIVRFGYNSAIIRIGGETLQALIACPGIDANMLLSESEITAGDVSKLFDLAPHMDEKKRSLLIAFARLLHKTEL